MRLGLALGGLGLAGRAAPPSDIPANVLTFNGQPLTYNGQYLTYGGANV